MRDYLRHEMHSLRDYTGGTATLSTEIVAGSIFVPLKILTELCNEIKHWQRANGGLGSVCNLWMRILPTRVANEDFADYVDEVNRLISERKHNAGALHLLRGVASTAINAVGYVLKSFGKRQAG